jgi:uncharacterized protein (TIGR02145 family)
MSIIIRVCGSTVVHEPFKTPAMTMRTFTSSAFWVILGIAAYGQDCTSVTDIDGHVYPVVQIGNQCWMAENLRTGHYRDGTEIANVTEGSLWDNYTTGAWCNYNNDPANDPVHGKLYNWHAVATGLLCPMGWHVANETEWGLLIDHLGGYQVAGGKMKTTGTFDEGTGLWNSPNVGATNESGFSAIPGGRRGGFGSGIFDGLGTRAFFWNAIGNAQYSQWVWGLGNDFTEAGGGAMPNPFSLGNCIRCLKDVTGTGMTDQQPARFTFAPNPTHSTVSLQFAPGPVPLSAALLDATGRVVNAQRITLTYPITLDLSGYQNGLYMVEVLFNDGSRAIERLIKE